jgi:hypothetical protein
MLKYLKRSLAFTVAIFLFYIIVDLIFAGEVDWGGDIAQSVVMSFVVIPFADCIVEMLKLK